MRVIFLVAIFGVGNLEITLFGVDNGNNHTAQEVTRAEKFSKFHLKVERNQKTVIELA